MHWGVPFHRAKKFPLTSTQEAVVDDICDELQRERASNRVVVVRPHSVFELLADIVQACLLECQDNATDLRMHLRADSPNEVKSLIERLRSEGT